MRAVLAALSLVLALSAQAAPPASRAVELAKAAKWEDLYLAYAAASPKDVPKKDRARIARALGEGCVALRGDDAVMAYSLGEKSVEFDLAADAALCAAAAAVNSDQRGAAEALLTKGKQRFPRDGRFPLELGRLALKEHDFAGAVKSLSAVSAKSKQHPEAQGLLKQARAGLDAQRGEDGLKRAGGGPAPRMEAALLPPGPGAGAGPAELGGSLTYRSTTDANGRQVMYNSRFRFRYFNGERDFGERADYEYRIRQALDEVYEAAAKALGTTRKTPVDVVLYSQEEFVAQFGPGLARAVAGLYSQSAIHMNHSASITEDVKATLVHEYTHAVIDELAGFREVVPAWLNEGVAEWTAWKYRGLDGPPLLTRKMLQLAAQEKRLPSLKSLSRGPLINGSASLNYALAGAAATELVKRRGVSAVVEVLRDLGIHEDLEKALTERVGKGLTSLEAELHQTLRRG